MVRTDCFGNKVRHRRKEEKKRTLQPVPATRLGLRTTDRQHRANFLQKLEIGGTQKQRNTSPATSFGRRARQRDCCARCHRKRTGSREPRTGISTKTRQPDTDGFDGNANPLGRTTGNSRNRNPLCRRIAQGAERRKRMGRSLRKIAKRIWHQHVGAGPILSPRIRICQRIQADRQTKQRGSSGVFQPSRPCGWSAAAVW